MNFTSGGHWSTNNISGNGSFDNSTVQTNGVGPRAMADDDPPTIKAVKAAALALVFQLSLIGNPLIIATVFKNHNRRMRTASNYFIVNLAVADLLMTTIQIPRAIVLVYFKHLWLIGGAVGLISCKLVIFVPFVAIFTSTLSFLVMAADRLLAVYYPMKRFFAGKTAGLVIALTWFLPTCYYYVYFHYAKLFYMGGKTLCGLSVEIIADLFKTMDAFYVTFTWVSFTLTIALPMLITAAFYSAIAVRLCKTKTPGQVSISERSRRQRTNVKVIKMLATVVLVFFLGYAPTLIGKIMCDTNKEFCTMPKYAFFKFFMLYSNSAVRPFIYPIFNQNFRVGISSILVGIFCCRRNARQQVFPHVDRSGTTTSRATFRSDNMPETRVWGAFRWLATNAVVPISSYIRIYSLNEISCRTKSMMNGTGLWYG